MFNKKILLSLCLILLVAISVSAVSADDASDVLEVEDSTDAVAVDDVSETLSDDPIQPETNTSASVQDAVNSATEGKTVDLSKFSDYDFADQTVTISNPGITIDGKGTTTIKGYGDGQGIFAIKAQNVVIQGIKFIDTNPKNNFTYNGTTAGWGISVSSAPGGLVKDCDFTDFNSGIVVMQTVGFNIENNKFHGGYSTLLANDPTVNKEQGTKALNIYRQSSSIVVKNNTFEGPILDGVSIAQGSGSNQVLDNTFIGNCYSIYFGGASTKGSLIKNNTFINCGFFKEGDIDWDDLPVISIQKSSDGISIVDNKFQARANNILIAGEAGNEAHGAPTSMGNINITGNTITPFENADMSTVTFFHILVRDGSSFEINEALNVTGNTFPEGVKGISVWFNDHEIFTADESVMVNTLYPDCIFNTTIETADVTVNAGEMGTLKITLKDSNNNTLRDKEVIITVGQNYIIAYTDANGVINYQFIEQNAGTLYVTIMYMGEGSIYKSSIETAKITVKAKATPAPVVAKKTTLTAKKATLKAKKAKKIKVTLKASGKAVAGKTVTIKVAKKTFKAKTNAKGVATIKVKVAKKGSYKATVKFAGDKAYKAASKTIKIKVKK